MRCALFTTYAIFFEMPYVFLVERAASPEARARFTTLLQQLPDVWPHTSIYLNTQASHSLINK